MGSPSKLAESRDQAVAALAENELRRRICKLTPPKPMIIIAQVDSSGTPDVMRFTS